MKSLKFIAVLAAILALMAVALPAQAGNASSCSATPGKGPVGTTFSVTCAGYTPGATTNIYAVEPDGRASGLNIYGFFPSDAQVDNKGVVSFSFVTEFPFFSVPPGDYTFVVLEYYPDSGGKVKVENHLLITVQSSPRPLLGASLIAGPPYPTGDQLQPTFDFVGRGFAAGEFVNVWVTQPPAANCSGLGIDQLTLGALGAGSSSLWSGRDTVQADASGVIQFTLTFRTSACRGVHDVSARALGSGRGAQTSVLVFGNNVRPANATVSVSPGKVPAFGTGLSGLTVSGAGFPANTGVSCWFTRPDGRVLGFISVDATTDSKGAFSASAELDDFPPYSSTEPGWWSVTCATPTRSALGQTSFLVYALTSDP